MRILLVNPPRSPENAILAHASPEAGRFVHKKLIGPPLGLLTVAAAVADHEVTVLEMKGEYDLDPGAPAPRELVTDTLTRVRPRVVGSTFIASEFAAGIEIFRAVKAFDPDILTVAGGLHATLCPGDFDDPAVDAVCPGPSAGTFLEIVRALEEGRPLAQVGGILVRSGAGLASTAAAAPPCDPAGRDFIMPDRSHLRPWLSTYVVGRAAGPSTYLFTSLGCPYQCSFCSIWPQFGGAYHQRAVESVIEELKTLDDYPVVRFADANTVVEPRFAEELFRRIEEEGIRKTFVMDIRVDTAAAHPGLIARLARGGLKVAITGFESFRREELVGYGKGHSGEMIARAIEVFHDNGVLLRGNYIVRPEYDERDFAGLAEFSAAHPVSFAGYTILTPMPGTAFYDESLDRIVDFDLRKYNFFNCVMKTRLPLEEFYRRIGDLWLIRKGEDTI